MKRFIFYVFLMMISLSLISCNTVIEYHGIEEYSVYNSEHSLSWNLLPSDNYLQEFKYIAGDYEYIDRGLTKREHEIMYLTYEKDIYNDAKLFVFENMVLSQSNHFLYNHYEFYENIGRKEYFAPDTVNDRFPYIFNMIGINDEKNTIIFMALRISPDDFTKKDEKLLTFEDMGAFLKEYFSFYNFEQ